MKKRIVSNEAIIAALIATGSIKEAAARVKLKPHTLSNRMREPEFITQYQHTKADLLKDTAAYMQNNLATAVNVLFEIATDPTNPPQTRANAADAYTRNCLKMLEAAEITERIEAIEAKLAEAEAVKIYEENIQEITATNEQSTITTP